MLQTILKYCNCFLYFVNNHIIDLLTGSSISNKNKGINIAGISSRNVKTLKKSISILTFLLMIIISNSCTQHGNNDYSSRPLRVLFIGNSLTHYNGGLDYLLRKMFAKSNPQLLIYSEKVAPGGERLSGHFKKGLAYKKIKEKSWDIVVIQEYSNGPLINREDFYKFSKLFVKEIRRNGANPMFYMTFSYRDNEEMTQLLSNSYMSVALDLKCEVIPVGIAWQKALNGNKNLDLYSDFKHPNKTGSYLIACVFYSFFTGKHPYNSTFTDNLDADTAKYLQNIAWETVTNWKSRYAK